MLFYASCMLLVKSTVPRKAFTGEPSGAYRLNSSWHAVFWGTAPRILFLEYIHELRREVGQVGARAESLMHPGDLLVLGNLLLNGSGLRGCWRHM